MTYEEIDQMDYLIAMATLDVADKDGELLKSLDDSKVVLSERIKKRIAKLLRKAEKQEKIAQRFQFSRNFTKVAVAMLIVVSVMFTATLSISAVRETIWEVMIEWFGEFMGVTYKPSVPEVKNPPEFIEEIRKPTLMINGLEEEVVMNTKKRYFVDYYKDDELVISFEQLPLTEKAYVDSEDMTIHPILIRGYEGKLLIYEEKERISIIWNDGEYSYGLQGHSISKDDLIMIAESVK